MQSGPASERTLLTWLGARQADIDVPGTRLPSGAARRRRPQRRFAAGAATLAALLLTGCGGSIGLPSARTEDPQRLDRSNALEAARLVVARSMDAAALVDLAGRGLVTPVVDPALAGSVVPRDVLACDNGPEGRVLLTVNDRQAPSGFISTGDVASMLYTSCLDQRLGRFVNGAADTTSIVVTDLEGPSDPVPPPPWFIGVDLEITGLSQSGPLGTAVLSGAVLTRQTTAEGEVFDRRLSTRWLAFDDPIGQDTLRDLQVIRVDDLRVGFQRYSLTVVGRASSTRLGGSFTFISSPPLRGAIGAPPSAGSLTVWGRDGTRLVISAEPGRAPGGVRLTLDDEGDGIDADDQNASVATTWTALGF